MFNSSLWILKHPLKDCTQKKRPKSPLLVKLIESKQLITLNGSLIQLKIYDDLILRHGELARLWKNICYTNNQQKINIEKVRSMRIIT